MDYEKKYKEALEKARQLCAYPTTKPFISDLQDLFPELKESEDEKTRKWIIDELKDSLNSIRSLYSGDYDSRDKDDILRESCLTKALAWLEKQAEQKPEWSEEDIEMIDWLIRCCEEEHKELCNDRYGHQEIVSDLKRDCRKKWNWLESLKNKVVPQSHWKPSEEQIDALEDAIADAVSSIQKNMLNSLYSDLKKL